MSHPVCADDAAFKNSLRKSVLDSAQTNRGIKARAVELKAVSDDLKARSDELQRQSDELLKASQAAQKSSEEVESSIFPSIDRYAQITCRNLCEHMQAKLSREIRDMIYEYISPRDVVQVEPLDGPPLKDGTPVYFATQFEKEHYWSIDYVGQQTSIELAEVFYRKSLFVLQSTKDSPSTGNVIRPRVKQFLETDQWGLGFAPASLVTRIEMNLLIEERNGDVDGFNDGQNGFQYDLDALYDLATLLKRKAKICITCSLARVFSHFMRKSCAQVLELLLEVLPRIKRKGHTVEVVFRDWSPASTMVNGPDCDFGDVVFSSSTKVPPWKTGPRNITTSALTTGNRFDSEIEQAVQV